MDEMGFAVKYKKKRVWHCERAGEYICPWDGTRELTLVLNGEGWQVSENTGSGKYKEVGKLHRTFREGKAWVERHYKN